MLFISPSDDLVYILQYINEFTKSINVKDVDVDTRKIKAIIAGAKQDGHYPTGGVNKATYLEN